MATNSGYLDDQIATSNPKEVIAEYILEAIEAGKVPSFSNFVEEKKDHIVSHTNIGDNLYNDWKSRFTIVSQKLGKHVVKDTPDWSKVCVALIERSAMASHSSGAAMASRSSPAKASRSSNSSADEQQTSGNSTISSLSSQNRDWVKNTYQSLKPSEKWWLQARIEGAQEIAVEDEMQKVALRYNKHHPAHSLIINPKDHEWSRHFSADQLNEIKTHRAPKLPALPSDLQEYLASYQGKRDLPSLLVHQKANSFDPYTQADLYWAQKSISDVLDLFIYSLLPDNDDTESDLLSRKWGFIRKAFDESCFKVRSGEKTSLSSSIRKNENRSPDEQGKLTRKLVGTKVDLSFVRRSLEYGCAEAGLSSDPYNTKAMDEGRLKLPRTLKDILGRLAKNSPNKLHEIKVPGFIISGLTLTLCIGDCPAGSVMRMTNVGPYEFPDDIAQFAKKFIPLLALVWQTKAIMKRTYEIINEDDTIVFPTIDGPEPSPIPPCMPSPKCGSKRTIAHVA